MPLPVAAIVREGAVPLSTASAIRAVIAEARDAGTGRVAIVVVGVVVVPSVLLVLVIVLRRRRRGGPAGGPVLATSTAPIGAVGPVPALPLASAVPAASASFEPPDPPAPPSAWEPGGPEPRRSATVGGVPVPRRYVTDAIVLSRFNLGEADRVLTLITPEYGKLKAIAKGVRRTTSRLGGSLEPFAELNVGLARGRTFDVVTEVRVGHAWLHLRDRLESAATAWYLAELADRSLEERHEAEALYALLRRAYELLDAGMAPGRVARWYEMHLADELGQRPEVDRCVECDRMLDASESFRWVPPLGGVLCGRCPGPPADRAGLSLEALKVLKAYQRLDIEAIAGLRLRDEVEREVENVMREFMRVVLERDPRSLAFLDEVRSAPGARTAPA